MTKDNTFIRKRRTPYIRKIAAVFMMFSMCICLASCARSDSQTAGTETAAETKPAMTLGTESEISEENIAITFEDAGMERALRDGMYKPNGSMMSNELLRVNGLSMDWRNNSAAENKSKEIKRLADLRWLPALETLYMLNCGIEDAEGVETLKKLRVLDLRDNEIQDFAPIGKLTELTDLRCSVTAETDYSALQSCTKLTALVIEGDGEVVLDLDVVKDMTQLEYLRINNAGVRDISVLENLENLKSLDMWGNRIQDITPLQKLTKLKVLSLSQNKIQDVTPLQNSLQLSELYLSDNEIKDITPLRKFGYIFNLHLEGNQIQDITPIMGFQNKNAVRLEDNPIPEKMLKEFMLSAEGGIKTATAPITADAVEADGTIGTVGESKENEEADPIQAEADEINETKKPLSVRKSDLTNAPEYRYEEYAGRSLYEDIEEFVVFDESLYGITKEKEAVLLKWGSHITPYDFTMDGKDSDKVTDRTRIVVPEAVNGCLVTGIAHGAMRENYAKEIILPDTLRVLEESAIVECTYLINVEIPDTVEVIGNYNFCDSAEPSKWLTESAKSSDGGMFIVGRHLLYCEQPQSETIIVPEGVAVIAQSAFWEIEATRLILPDSLRAIYSLPYGTEQLNIPKGVRDIDCLQFTYAPWMENKLRQAENGMLIINDILLAVRNEYQEEITIPYGVRKISGAFYDHLALQKVTMPETVTDIGEYAFAYCTNLSEIVMSPNITRIGTAAFVDCHALERIELPRELRTIKEAGFGSCDALREIVWNDKLTSIREAAFFANGIERVHIPDNVRHISDAAFCDSMKLSFIRIPHGEVYIEDRAFAQDWDEYKVTSGHIITKEVLMELPENPFCFYNGAELFTGYGLLEERTNIAFIVPKDSEAEALVKKDRIQNGTLRYQYRYDKEAENIDATVNKSGQEAAPNRAEELQKLRIEPVVGEVTSYIKIDNAMYGLTEDREAALIHYAKVKGADKTIVIPNNVEGCPVTVIASGAIRDSDVEKIVLPANLRTIENAAITGCEKLRELDMPNTVTRIGNDNFGLLSSYEDEAVYNPWVIKELEKSGNDMLIVNGHLLLCADSGPTVTIPDGVRVITAGAFAVNIKEEAYEAEYEVQQLVLPDSLRAIYSLPESLRYMEVSKNIVDIELNGTLLEDMPWLTERQEASDNQTVIINGILLSAQGEKEFTVPDGVWKISGVIRNKYAIESVVLPDSVEEIGAYTFSGCAYIYDFEFGENVRYIGEEAFAYCDNLYKLRLPHGISSIARGTFYQCGRLSIIMPIGVRSIGEKAFYKCDSLDELMLPAGIRYIGNRAFQECNLKKASLPSSTRYIGTEAFENNFGLESIVIPGEVCYVASGAFANCSELQYIKLEDGVDYIGDRVFDILIAEDDRLDGADRDDFASWLSREEVAIELPYQLPVSIEPSVWEDFAANSYVQLRTDIVFVVRKTSKTVDTLRKYINDNGITKYRVTYTYFPPLQLRRQESVIGEFYDTSDSVLRKEKKFETLRNRQFSRYDRY